MKDTTIPTAMANDELYVIRVINNNIVITKNNQNQEYIAIGKGLGYRKNVNDRVLPNEIQKKYVLMSNSNYIFHILEYIPFEVLELTEKIVDLAQDILKNSFNVTLVVALADHINFSVTQYQLGIKLPVLVNEEIKRFYKEEYGLGQQAVFMINEAFNIHLAKEEAASIAFHLIAATEKRSNHDALKIMNGVSVIIEIVENELGIVLDEDSAVYARFVIHLKYFMRCVLFEQVKLSNDSLNQVLLTLERISDRASNCVVEIVTYILEHYDYVVTKEDQLYLLIHIIRVLDSFS